MVENNPYVVMSNELRWPDLLVMGTPQQGAFGQYDEHWPTRPASAQ